MGLGRTALLAEVVRREAADGAMRVLSARGAPEESAFPFALLRQLFPDAGYLPFADPPVAEEQRTFHRLVNHLSRTAERQPVLLAVDDLHDADAASRRWIGYLARRLDALPVLLVLTDECQEEAATALPPATGTSVLLRPLGPAAVTRLVSALGHDADRAELSVGACAGSPALVHDLLSGLREGALPRRLSDLAGSRYRDTIAHWIRIRADSRSRRLALALALTSDCSTALDEALLHEIAGLGPESRAALPAASCLGRLFSHPLAREAALAAADPAELDVLRRRVARLLDERGAPARSVAAHLVHIERPDEEWMTQSLEDAAEEAARAGLADQATAHLRHALTGPLPPGRRAALVLRLGALELPHCADAAIRRLRGALELDAGHHERATVAPALGAALVARGRADTALRLMHQVGSAMDDGALVRVLQTTAAVMASHDADAWLSAVAQMRDLATTAPATVEPLACALVTEYEAGKGELSAADVLSRVLPRLAGTVDPRLRTAWLGAAATLLQWADRLDEARALALGTLPAPPALPDLTDVGQQCLLSVRAEAALWAGDFRRVVAENTPLLAACTGQGVRMPHLVSMVALAQYELGHRDQAWRLLAGFDEDGADSSWEWNELRYARALLHTAEGRWQAALDDHLACGAGQDAREFVSPVATPWRSGAAMVLVRLGQPSRAMSLAEEELRHARTWGTARTVGRALRAVAAASGGRRGLAALDEAVTLLRTAPAPVELVEALIDLGRARIDAGSGRKGRDDLCEALSLALRLLAPGPAGRPEPAAGAGAAPVTGRLVRVAEEALRAGGVRRTRRDTADGPTLTRAERRITELAVRGRSNAEIGAELCLARRTVETHLTNAYRKLGVTRRTQLAALLGRVDVSAFPAART